MRLPACRLREATEDQRSNSARHTAASRPDCLVRPYRGSRFAAMGVSESRAMENPAGGKARGGKRPRRQHNRLFSRALFHIVFRPYLLNHLTQAAWNARRLARSSCQWRYASVTQRNRRVRIRRRQRAAAEHHLRIAGAPALTTAAESCDTHSRRKEHSRPRQLYGTDVFARARIHPLERVAASVPRRPSFVFPG